MRNFLFCLLLTLCGGAAAQTLSDAYRVHAEKKYAEALALFEKLARAGDAEAKLRLGEMYWYGEGMAAPDRDRADGLFRQAHEAGNKEAAEALTLSARRAARSADIARWTGGYDGADLTAGKYACPLPTIPDVSKNNKEIKATSEAYAAWSQCYNGFVQDLEGPLAPANRIPPDLAVLMTDAEKAQAAAHLNQVYASVVDKVAGNANAVIARHAAWEKATQAFVAEHNNQVAARDKADLEAGERMRRIWEFERDARARGRVEPPPVQRR